MFFPGITRLFLYLQLTLTVLLESLKSKRRKHNVTTTFLCFRFSFNITLPCFLDHFRWHSTENAPDLQRLFCKALLQI